MIRVRYAIVGMVKDQKITHDALEILRSVGIRYAVSLTRCAHPYAARRYEVGTLGCGYGCKIDRCDTCGTDLPVHRGSYGCAQ